MNSSTFKHPIQLQLNVLCSSMTAYFTVLANHG